MTAENRQDQGPLLPALVRAAARRFPTGVAVEHAQASLRYDRLDTAGSRLAHHLRASGLQGGDLLGLCLPRSIERIAITLAAWRLGAAVVMLDPEWPARRIAQIQDEANWRMIAVAADAPITCLDTARIFRVNVDGLQQDAADPVLTKPVPDASLAPDDLAYLIYTSGSSGQPKGVEITHGNLAALVAWHNAAFAISPADRATHLAGLAFDAAIWEVWPYLAAGASVHVAPEPVRGDPEGLRDWLVRTEATVAFAPTLLAERLIGLPWPQTSLRTLLTGGDRLRSRPPPGLPFTLVNNYGPAECTVVACSGAVPPEPSADTPPPIGRPIAGAYIQILNGAGLSVTDGAVGEIHIGGDLVGRGYRGQTAATAERFVTDPLAATPGARLYRTGDLGSWRPDGAIDFHGRADDQLQVRGQRLEPGEIAVTLMRHPQVRAAAVAGISQAEGMTLAAYVVPTGDPAPAAEELHAFLAERLPKWSVPTHFMQLAELPVTAHGKLDRTALPVPSMHDALAARAHAEPANPTERRLIAILHEVMGEREIGIDDNFFLLGGHSLLGTQVVLRACDAFGVELTLRHLFQAPTVRELAATIETLVMEAVAAMSDEELLRRHG